MIDYASDFSLLNYLFNAILISTTPAFGLSLEYLIYQVSVRSCRVMINVAFFILLSVTPYASHRTLITNQNWSRSSFPIPLNTGNFIALAISTRGGSMGEDGGEGSDTGGGVGGSGMHIILFLIKLITILGETFVSSSLPPRGGEIKGLVSNFSLPSFL